MEKLIQALIIFLKYGNPTYPTHCEHDELIIMSYNIGEISKEDVEKLDELGFLWDEEGECFKSFKFGSA
jgi:hypothetical protein